MQSFCLAWDFLKEINQFLPVTLLNGIECCPDSMLVCCHATGDLGMKCRPVVILIRSRLLDRDPDHTLVFLRRAIAHTVNRLTQNSNRRIVAIPCRQICAECDQLVFNRHDNSR